MATLEDKPIAFIPSGDPGREIQIVDAQITSGARFLRYTLPSLDSFKTLEVTGLVKRDGTEIADDDLPVLCLVSDGARGSCVEGYADTKPGSNAPIFAVGFIIDYQKNSDWWSAGQNIILTTHRNWPGTDGDNSQASYSVYPIQMRLYANDR
jgi:hypothetical protein